MEKEQLQRLIASLHEELSTAGSVDEQSQALLRKLTGDIENLAAGDDAPPGAAESAAGQLEEAALRFKSEHPKLSMALGELVDALGKLGI
jgi:ABC-type transporter Mla subunit MlaD